LPPAASFGRIREKEGGERERVKERERRSLLLCTEREEEEV